MIGPMIHPMFRPMRSKLFVPASRPELFAKALAGAADALSFDLEDSVVEARKDEARAALGAFLRSDAARAGTKILMVRVNAIGTPHFAADIAAVVLPGVTFINLPKPESTEQVCAAVAAIEAAERANGVCVSPAQGVEQAVVPSLAQAAAQADPAREPVKLLLNIETPAALRRAHELASAHPRVAGLQLGLADLFEPLGIARRDTVAIQQTMLMVRMAAGEAGVFAYDAAFADINDTEGFRAEAQMARRMGMIGKSCIHPRQIALANEVFRPADDEIAHALKVVQAAAAARAGGAGAWVVDGKMIDPPFVARAEAIVAAARQLGLLGADGSSVTRV